MTARVDVTAPAGRGPRTAPGAGPGVRPPDAGHDPIDWEFCRALERKVLGPIIRDYFRARVVGAERLPKRGPVMLVANHSGNAFPHDGIVLDATLWQHDGYRPSLKFRTAYEPELTMTWWMRPFGIDDFWRRGGGVDMTFDNFERLLRRGDRVLYFPEGVPGIGKGFNRRYQLQTFKTSFVLLAGRHQVPVFPVYVINAEWVHPFGYCIPALDRLMQRVFHVPFLPLPIGLLACVFPWMWYLAFPCRMVFVVGKPIDVPALLWLEGVTDFAHPDRAALQRTAERVRHLMQGELDALVAEHGRQPYHRRSLWRALKRNWGRWRTLLPWGWPVAYLRLERDRRRPAARNRLHALLRDWDLIGFYLPFGWPFLSLFRALRRPPYGYRGLTRKEKRERMGNHLWRLSERPLPPLRG